MCSIISYMNRHSCLSSVFNEDEISKIVAVLKTLTGDQLRFVLPILPLQATQHPVRPFENNPTVRMRSA
jgi:hypothetical protein